MCALLTCVAFIPAELAHCAWDLSAKRHALPPLEIFPIQDLRHRTGGENSRELQLPEARLHANPYQRVAPSAEIVFNERTRFRPSLSISENREQLT